MSSEGLHYIHDKICISTMVGMVRADPMVLLISPQVQSDEEGNSHLTGRFSFRYKGPRLNDSAALIANVLRDAATGMENSSGDF